MLKLGRVRVGGGFLLLFAAAYYICRADVFACFVLSAALHEIGHIAAAKTAGARIETVSLTLFGAELQISSARLLSYGNEIFIALAGPLSNLFGAAAAGILARHSGSAWLYFFSGANVLLGLFNLLPAGALDGGRALYFFIRLYGEERSAYDAVTVSTLAVTAAVFCGGIFVFMKGNGNLSALAVSGFLAYGLICERLNGACKKGVRRVK